MQQKVARESQGNRKGIATESQKWPTPFHSDFDSDFKIAIKSLSKLQGNLKNRNSGRAPFVCKQTTEVALALTAARAELSHVQAEQDVISARNDEMTHQLDALVRREQRTNQELVTAQ